MDHKIQEIIEKIIEKWSQNKIEWQHIDDLLIKLEAKLKEKKIVLAPATDIYYFTLMDNEGKVIFNQRIHRTANIIEQQLYNQTHEMYKSVKRKLSGIDEKLEDILGDLNEI